MLIISDTAPPLSPLIIIKLLALPLTALPLVKLKLLKYVNGAGAGDGH